MKKIITAVISGGLFAGLIVMLGKYDVAPIGPQGTTVGFSTINKAVHELTGVNMNWYYCTEWLGYAALLICALFALAGLVQLIRRKSLLKVDWAILLLGGLYLVVFGLYFFFDNKNRGFFLPPMAVYYHILSGNTRLVIFPRKVY